MPNEQRRLAADPPRPTLFAAVGQTIVRPPPTLYALVAFVSMVGVAWLLTRLHDGVPVLYLLVLVAVSTLSLVRGGSAGAGLFFFGVAFVTLRLGRHPLDTIPLKPALSIEHMVLCGGVLTAMTAHWRYASFRTMVTPRGPAVVGARRWFVRKKKKKEADALPVPEPVLQEAACRRAADSLRPDELAAAPLLVLFWPAAALTTWGLVQYLADDYLKIAPPVGRLLVGFWLLTAVVVVLRTVLRSVRHRLFSPAEAAAQLDDVVWRELRGELSTIGRFLGRRR
ncbi:MAG: hypothetical protein ACRC1K_20160 [Planctomycetia bacterium]